MTTCYFETNTNDFFSRRKLIEPTDYYNFNKIKTFIFRINYNKLIQIIKNILFDFCNADVIGFDTRTNKYWCKIVENKCCMLNIELEIIRKDNSNSFVSFIPLIGSQSLIENFMTDFKESVQLYNTSCFIKTCLDKA
jgi:hypothetical protein